MTNKLFGNCWLMYTYQSCNEGAILITLLKTSMLYVLCSHSLQCSHFSPMMMLEQLPLPCANKCNGPCNSQSTINSMMVRLAPDNRPSPIQLLYQHHVSN